MTPGLAVVLDCYRAGIEVWPDQAKKGRVLFRPVDRMTPELSARLRKYKQQIDRAVPNGWSRERWVTRLRALADRCAELNPARTAELRLWANAISENGKPT